MASCAYCNSFIFFGGKKQGDLRFCNAECQRKGYLAVVAAHLPTVQVAQHVSAVHRGTCPSCGKEGPIDVHTSYRIYSALLFTSWSSRPAICCKSCGLKKKIGDLFFSLVLGWWGLPWGIIMTPVQLMRNLFAIFNGPNPSEPSAALENLLRLHIAEQMVQNQNAEEAISA